MTAATAPSTADLIEERTGVLDDLLERVLRSGDPSLDLYRWAAYHLGWLAQDLTPLPAEVRTRFGGKRLRGVLTVLAAEASGGSAASAAAGGAAIELIHNFSLVHDDIEDGDESRRHRPTVWKLWGVPHAINVGSSMQALVNRAVLLLAVDHPPDRVLEASRVVTDSIIDMTEGQYLDMAAEDGRELDLEGYERMTGGKTAALLRGALHLGALLGGASRHEIEAYAEFGWEFGLAFQCRDDYLGVWGIPDRTGKPVGSDILRGKRSLPVVHALVQCPPSDSAGRELRRALTQRDVPAVLAAFDRLSTADSVDMLVRDHTEKALAALARASGREPYRTAILDIAESALGREH